MIDFQKPQLLLKIRIDRTACLSFGSDLLLQCQNIAIDSGLWPLFLTIGQKGIGTFLDAATGFTRIVYRLILLLTRC